MKITLMELKSKGACQDQVDLFIELGLHKREITLQDCLDHASEIDWDWASENLLKGPALAEYVRVRDLAHAEYNRVCDPVLAENSQVSGQAMAEYVRVSGPALAEYGRVSDPAWDEYKRVQASTFFQLKESAQ